MNLGTILISDLHFNCIIGILPDERTFPQTITVDVELTTDFSACAKSENIQDTIDYVEVGQQLKSLLEVKKYQLVETFAVEACELLLNGHLELYRVKVTIRKPNAVENCRFVGVCLEKTRNE